MKSCKVAKSTKIVKLENTLVSQKESNARITQKLRTKLQLSKDEITKLTEENSELKNELKRSEQSKQQLVKEFDQSKQQLLKEFEQSKQQLLKEFETSKQQLSKELEEKRLKIRKQKSIIATLQDDNTKSKGILIGMNSAKPHTVNNKITNNNIVNQKLSLIPIDNIEPFTIDLVNRNLGKYDYNTFLKGALGIVNYIKELTILELDDGTVEKNYACTNRSRNTFHRLVEDKEWKQDGGARFIQEILTALSGQASEHMERLTKELNDEPVRSNKKQVLLEYQMKLADLEYGLRNKNSKERNEIFNQVKTEVRDSNGC
jgi:hypothetical protein